MKKRLCIFLICWLPCFVMAANVMAMQMLLSQTTPAQAFDTHVSHQTQAMDEMPCHEHQAGHRSQNNHSPQVHHCNVCGFCAISGGVAHFHALANLPLIVLSSATPLFVDSPVHSQSYPPAIKPPIFS